MRIVATSRHDDPVAGDLPGDVPGLHDGCPDGTVGVMRLKLIRLGARVLLVGAILGVPVACVGRSSTSSAPETGSAVDSHTGHDGVALECDQAIGKVGVPPQDYEIVLDAVALPTADAATRALQAGPGSDGGVGDGWLFAKTGLLVRGTKASTLDVPNSERGRLLIGWGSPAHPTEHLTVAQCGHDDQWLAFAGGFWVPTAGCVAVDITAGSVVRRVMIGVGAPCDGQQPPSA